jgi:hypothetical protein
MHVGEPAFAAQLQLRDGQVLDFDDPGCLFAWWEVHMAHGPVGAALDDAADVHAVYFHHARADRWLSLGEVGFVAAQATPMGFGFAAVAADEDGARDWRWAAARARQTERPAAPARGLHDQ